MTSNGARESRPNGFRRRMLTASHGTGLPGEHAAYRRRVRDARIAGEGETRQRPLTRGLVPAAARVADENRNVSQVRRVTHRRLDADFEYHADDRDRLDTAVAQHEIERRPLERRHRDLVEHG